MDKLILDAIDPVEIDRTKHANEVNTLVMLQRGLCGLANNVTRREAPFREMAKKATLVSFGRDVDAATQDIDMVACFFHWFGVSLCNYARLVGYLRGLTNGEFTRADLSDPAKTTSRVVKKSVDAYVDRIPELKPVSKWRDKISAHFAITDPRKDDNIATLDMSVVFPVAMVDGRYRVHHLQMIRSGASGAHTSEIPEWSITEVIEQIIPRFWPGMTINPVPEP